MGDVCGARCGGLLVKGLAMSIRDVLHLDWLLEAADDAWPDWAVEEPVLGPFVGVGDMSRWRLSASWREDREVFLALGRLSLDKRWRHEAQAVLVLNVLPACEAIVRQRSGNGADADYVEQTAAGLVWEGDEYSPGGRRSTCSMAL